MNLVYDNEICMFEVCSQEQQQNYINSNNLPSPEAFLASFKYTVKLKNNLN